MKNRKTFLITLLTMTVIFSSCSSDDEEEDRGNWIDASAFDGIPRANAASFTIGDYGYMGTGYDGDDYLTDFWQYDINGNYWVQKADFPGTARSSASGFAIYSKGYIGIGYDGDDELSDFWEYNPDTNSWEQKADFGGGVRRGAISFGANSTGYIGTGYDGDYDKKDFWKYEPTTDAWTQLLGFGGNKRIDGTAFVINDMVYIGTGVTNGIYQTDFWKFDPTTEGWTSLQDLDEDDDYSIVRSNAVSFALGALGYVTTGYYGGVMSSVWEYDPSSDEWEEITALEASARQDATSFSNGNKAFVALGKTGSLYLYDAYEILPQEDYDDED